MSWTYFGSDCSLVMHKNNFGDNFRVSIENDGEFSQSECREIQDIADKYFSPQRLEDISEESACGNSQYRFFYRKTMLSNNICIRIEVERNK